MCAFTWILVLLETKVRSDKSKLDQIIDSHSSTFTAVHKGNITGYKKSGYGGAL